MPISVPTTAVCVNTAWCGVRTADAYDGFRTKQTVVPPRGRSRGQGVGARGPRTLRWGARPLRRGLRGGGVGVGVRARVDSDFESLDRE